MAKQGDVAGPSPSGSRLHLQHKWLVLIAAGAGTFMGSLDGSIVNSILPLLRKALNAQFDASEWIFTIYLLTISSVLLIFGRLGDLHGHRTVFSCGFGLFALASMFCAASHSLWMLVASRGLQAVGGAMVMANAPALITDHFPDEQRGMALGWQSTMTYIGLTLGPTTGGFLASALGWRSVFFVNVPVAAIALTLTLVWVPNDRPKGKTARFDLLGGAIYVVAMTLLLIVLNQGHRYGWGSSPIVTSFVVALTLGLGFIWLEATRPEPMLDLALFRNPVFSASAVAAVATYICTHSVVFLVPYYLLDGRGVSPVTCGLMLTIQPVIMVFIAPGIGSLSDRIGTRLPATCGMLVLAVGLFLMSRLGASTPLWFLGLALALEGVGNGLFSTPNNSALMGAAPSHRQGVASAMMGSARNVGMALGVGLSGAVVTTVESHWPAGSAAGMYSAVHWSFCVVIIVSLIGASVSMVRADLPTAAKSSSPAGA